MYSLVGSSVSWLHANLQVLSLCHCSILNQFPLKKMIKKKKKQKKTQVIYMSIQILSLWFFFFFECYVNLRRFIPLFVFIWMEKWSKAAKKAKKKKKGSLRFYQWQKIHIVFWWILFQSVHQLVLGDDRCFNELLH